VPETGRGQGLPVSRAEVVEVVIPARPEFVSVVRLAAATVAARQGFTYDEIEDLKIAVGEACTALLVSGSDSGHPMTVRFVLGHDTLEVNLAARGNAIDLHPAAVSDRAPLDEARLGVFLMQCLVDEVEARHDRSSGTAELRLVKRRQG
jgi:serine/threonine-protein kinase RsbW